MIPRPILHELGFLVTFMGWLGLAAMIAWVVAALVVAALYAGWWVVR